eukprot:PLAT15935.1.p2 GENE.PLAT15935.1~~PLAT15935.1.p2  ORF type:complete len:238 (+),score=111.52 PLAT15935.1:42-716(+)
MAAVSSKLPPSAIGGTGESPHHPSALRNRPHQLAVVRKLVEELAEDSPAVLEVASGTGAHVELFAAELPAVTFTPSCYTDSMLPRLQAVLDGFPGDNIKPAVVIDVMEERWAAVEGDSACYHGLLVSNLLHISPWEATVGLMAGAGRLLLPGGFLHVYGPFMVDGKPTTESNERFHASLQRRDASWGLRDVADVAEQAAAHGLTLEERVEQPSNNFSLVFKKGE